MQPACTQRCGSYSSVRGSRLPLTIWDAYRLRCLRATQELYEAVPIALAPVLGNPLSLAAAGVDRTLPLQEQVFHRIPSLLCLFRLKQ